MGFLQRWLAHDRFEAARAHRRIMGDLARKEREETTLNGHVDGSNTPTTRRRGSPGNNKAGINPWQR